MTQDMMTLRALLEHCRPSPRAASSSCRLSIDWALPVA